MSEEIKEILYLQNYIDKYKSDEKAIIKGNRLTTPAMLDYLEVKALLNYITSLQQKVEQLEKENEYLKMSNPEQNMEHFRIVNENKRKIDMLRKENHQLENIRKEAIEYINKMWLAKLTPGTVSDTKFDLLNILNKGEKERIEKELKEGK